MNKLRALKTMLGSFGVLAGLLGPSAAMATAAPEETGFVAKTPEEAVQMAIEHITGVESLEMLGHRKLIGLPAPSAGVTFLARAVTRASTNGAAESDAINLPIEVSARQGGQVITSRIFVFPREEKVPTVVLLRAIDAGEKIEPGDVAIERVKRAFQNEKVASNAEDVIGRVVTRRLSAGSPIALRNVRAVFVVKRGDTLSVNVRSGGVTVSMKGSATENGAVGDLIGVINSASGRVLKARIASAGEAEVEVSR